MTAALAVVLAGPTASASAHGGRAHAPAHAHAHASATSTAKSSSSRPKVKYYIVQPAKNGHRQFLYEIASVVLGKGELYREIFNLNKGRLQPDGARLETPTSIKPGWILLLPPTASGPGVHFGPLPVVSPRPAAPAAHSPSPAAAAGGGAIHIPFQKGSSSLLIILGAILVALIALAGLAAGLSRRKDGHIGTAPTPPDAGDPQTPKQPDGSWNAAIRSQPADSLSPSAILAQGGADDASQTCSGPPVSFEAAMMRPPTGNGLSGMAPGGNGPVGPGPAANGAQRPGAGAQTTRSHVDGPRGRRPDDMAPTEFSPVALRLLGAQRSSARRAKTARVPTVAHEVDLGGDRIKVVLAETPAVRREGKSGSGQSWLTATPYLVWTDLPYDAPDDGTAFACLGAGEEGSLFIDLAAAPGAVAIGGNGDAATRLAESLVQQLSTAPAASRARIVVVGDMLPGRGSSGVQPIPSLSQLGTPGSPESDERAELVFCRLDSNEDAFLLARYVSSAQRRVVPVVLANLPDAPWSLNAQPSRHLSVV